MLKKWEYEKVKLKYSIPHTYNPDFSLPGIDWIIIEAKGRFINGSAEARKYVEVAKEHKDKEIVFIFEKSHIKAYTGLRKRKDGTFMSLGEWAAKNRFVSWSEKDVPHWFVLGEFTREDIEATKREQREYYFGK